MAKITVMYSEQYKHVTAPGPSREGEEKGPGNYASACTNYLKKIWGAINDCTLFYPPPVDKGTRQCHIGAASYSRPQEEGSVQSFVASHVFLG